MTIQTIKKAQAEAKRFLTKVDEVMKHSVRPSGVGMGEWINTGKDTSALKRASMDLTRALAEMRKP